MSSIVFNDNIAQELASATLTACRRMLCHDIILEIRMMRASWPRATGRGRFDIGS